MVTTAIAAIAKAAELAAAAIRQVIDAYKEFRDMRPNFSITGIGKFIPGSMGLRLLDLLKRQHGGPVQAGRPYLVGEAGPELVVPRSQGTVIPNNQLGGGSTTVNLNVNLGVFSGSPIERRKLAETIWRDLQDVARSKNMSLI